MIVALVVNYNSLYILWVAKTLLAQILDNVDFVIVVDNGSTDGSNRRIVEYLREIGLSYLYLQLPYNIGFTRAVNIAWKKIKDDLRYRYLILLNNDLIPAKYVIKRLIDVMESRDFAGIQGTIMQLLRPWLIDNAGHIVDRFGLSYPVCRGRPFSCARDYEPSYLSGAFSIYKMDALRRIGTPFSDVYEAYFDDKLLGARLRRRGYRLFHKRVLAGFHLGSATYGPRTLFKSARWFRYISAAELIPVFRNAPLPIKLLVTLKYLTAGAVGSLFTTEDYVKSFVESIKFASLNHPEAEFVRSPLFSFWNFLLQNPFVGVRPPKDK